MGLNDKFTHNDLHHAFNFLTTPEVTEAHVPRPCIEWRYSMRRSMQEVAPGLYLGPHSLAQRSKMDLLRHHDITHIVCVRQDVEARFIKPNFPEEFQYLTLNIADNSEENIKQYFETVKTFVDEAFARGGKVLIHGNTGQSRSATLAVAYIMRQYGVGAEDALGVVRARRLCVCPNRGFLEQLEEYGAQLALLREETAEGWPSKMLRFSDDLLREETAEGWPSKRLRFSDDL